MQAAREPGPREITAEEVLEVHQGIVWYEQMESGMNRGWAEFARRINEIIWHRPAAGPASSESLREAAQAVIEWENEYRTLNHLGRNPPSPFVRLAIALASAPSPVQPSPVSNDEWLESLVVALSSEVMKQKEEFGVDCSRIRGILQWYKVSESPVKSSDQRAGEGSEK